MSASSEIDFDTWGCPFPRASVKAFTALSALPCTEAIVVSGKRALSPLQAVPSSHRPGPFALTPDRTEGGRTWWFAPAAGGRPKSRLGLCRGTAH